MADATVFDVRGESLSDDELDELTRMLSAELPSDYLAFMASGDGGVFVDPNRYGSSRRGGLNELFALREGSPTYWSFAAALDTYRGRLPIGFVPIGDDLAGNLLLLGVDDVHWGAVYFWDHERESQEGELAAMGNMELVAGSFSEFLDSIRIADQ